MESKAKLFVEQFEKSAQIIAKNAPKEITYSIFIYARSPEEKSEKFPDGDSRFKSVDNTNFYDRATIEQYIKENRRMNRGFTS